MELAYYDVVQGALSSSISHLVDKSSNIYLIWTKNS